MASYNDTFSEILASDPQLRELALTSQAIQTTPILPDSGLIDYRNIQLNQDAGEALRDALGNVASPSHKLTFANGIFQGPKLKLKNEEHQLYAKVAQNQTGVTEGEYMYFYGDDIVIAERNEEMTFISLPENLALCARLIGATCTTFLMKDSEKPDVLHKDSAVVASPYWGGVIILDNAVVCERAGYGIAVERYDEIQIAIGSTAIAWAHIPNYSETLK